MARHTAATASSATASATAYPNEEPGALVQRSNQASAHISVAVAAAAGVTRRSRRQPSQLVSTSPTMIATSSPAHAVFQCRATALSGSWVAMPACWWPWPA